MSPLIATAAHTLERRSQRRFSHVMQQFVRYAAAAGSQNSSRYYIHLSRLVCAFANVPSAAKAVGNERLLLVAARQYLSLMLLRQMQKKVPYKQIYAHCRQKVKGGMPGGTAKNV